MNPLERARDAVIERQAELEQDKAVKLRRKAQQKEKKAFDALPEQTKMEFWCEHCQIDFVAPAYKIWSDVHSLGSWQSVCCRCERMVYRHVNQKTDDPYYAMSAKIRVMRGEAANDMLTPHDYGFKTLYGDPFEHYYRRFQEQEESMHNRYAALGLTGLTLSEKSEQEQFMEAIET